MFSEKKYEYLGMIVYRIYKICEISDIIIKGNFGSYIAAEGYEV